MHTKAVYHAAKAFASFGLPVLRFNFRGVGRSEGAHGYGLGEQHDVRAALDWLALTFPHSPILFAGFSFGSYVGLRACCGDPRVKGLVALGLPIRAGGRDYAYDFLSHCTAPKLFLSGDHDEFAPRDLIEQAVALAPEPKQLVWIAGADHFFQGTPASPSTKLDRMTAAMRLWLGNTFNLAGPE
jgi:alpha/beta superfamily hydrolase